MDFVAARNFNTQHRELTKGIRRLRRRELDLLSQMSSATKAGNLNRAHDLNRQRGLVTADREKCERAAGEIEKQAIEAGWQ